MKKTRLKKYDKVAAPGMTDLLPVWPQSGVHGGAVVCNSPSDDTSTIQNKLFSLTVFKTQNATQRGGV